MQHGAHSAEEVRVDELPRAFPSEVGVVEIIICVQFVEVCGQLCRRLELVHVDVGAIGGCALIVLGSRTHHDREDIPSVTNINYHVTPLATGRLWEKLISNFYKRGLGIKSWQLLFLYI